MESDDGPARFEGDAAEASSDRADEPAAGGPATDAPTDPATDADFHTALPPRIEAWRKRSATGAILTGLALGLQEALEKEREDPGIVMQTSGEPPKDLPVEADFEYRRPRHSVVNIRPWLIERSDRADADPVDADRADADQTDRADASQSDPGDGQPKEGDETETP